MAKSVEAAVPQVQLPAWVAEQYSAFEQNLNGSRREALHERRVSAFKKFSAAGFPTPHDEAWKYTNLSSSLAKPYTLGSPEATLSVDKTVALDIPGARLVVANGAIVSSLSSAKWPEGVQVSSLDDALAGRASAELAEAARTHLGKYASAENDPVSALNTAFLKGGVLVLVRNGIAVKEPISVTFVTSGAVQESPCAYPRLLVVAGEQSELTLIERHLGHGAKRYLSTAVTEIVAGNSAHIDHYKVIEDAEAATHLGTVALEGGRAANLRTHTFTFGGALVRNQLAVGLRGEGAYALLNGLTVISGEQHVDNNTILDHAEPHCESHELYKGIYADKAQGVFSGTIVVQPGAQKTNAYQSNQSVLLSDEAGVNSRPQLKIWADDVKCTHGATVGQLDDDAMFYMRSRGIGIEDARNMLLQAFAGEVIRGVTPALQPHLEAQFAAKLRR